MKKCTLIIFVFLMLSNNVYSQLNRAEVDMINHAAKGLVTIAGNDSYSNFEELLSECNDAKCSGEDICKILNMGGGTNLTQMLNNQICEHIAATLYKDAQSIFLAKLAFSIPPPISCKSSTTICPIGVLCIGDDTPACCFPTNNQACLDDMQKYLDYIRTHSSEIYAISGYNLTLWLPVVIEFLSY